MDFTKGNLQQIGGKLYKKVKKFKKYSSMLKQKSKTEKEQYLKVHGL